MKIVIKKEYGQILPYSEEDRVKLDKFEDGVAYVVDIKNFDLRTAKQNNALHLWCQQIADTLNAHGLYVGDVIKTESEWNMEKVKANIFKSAMMSLYDKKSTTTLNRGEIDGIINVIAHALGKKNVVVPPFPERSLWEESKKD
jgi:hypothetical protein